MNLLGMGPGELLLIAMLGLIVFGPGRLPEIAAQAGRIVRDLRRSTSDMTREFQEAMAPLNELAELHKELPRALGPAAVMAQNGVTTPTEDAAPVVAAAAPEPALAETADWHWEGGPAAAPADEPPPASSFWDWSAPEPAPPNGGTGPVEAGPADSVWQWDGAEAAEPTRARA